MKREGITRKEAHSAEILSPSHVRFCQKKKKKKANCCYISSKQLPEYWAPWETSSEDSLSGVLMYTW